MPRMTLWHLCIPISTLRSSIEAHWAGVSTSICYIALRLQRRRSSPRPSKPRAQEPKASSAIPRTITKRMINSERADLLISNAFSNWTLFCDISLAFNSQRARTQARPRGGRTCVQREAIRLRGSRRLWHETGRRGLVWIWLQDIQLIPLEAMKISFYVLLQHWHVREIRSTLRGDHIKFFRII